MSAAILRISESLDFLTVLREVVAAARALTRARSGAIAKIDDVSQPLAFVSSGISADEHRQLEAWRDGPRLFGHFRAPTLSLPTQRPAGLSSRDRCFLRSGALGEPLFMSATSCRALAVCALDRL